MSEYRVNLEIFAGPLDLLLYLVRKDEVDIYDIPIARITEQYITYIEMLKHLDIDLVGDFLIMAATLMEIKSAMLLPQVSDEEAGEEEAVDPRTELVRQLLEYKKYKDAANFLQDSAEKQQMRFIRPDNILSRIEPDTEPQLDLDQISIWTLLEAFDSILKATGFTSPYDHIHDDTPIDLHEIEILHRLQTEGPMTFEKLFERQTNRLVMIGLFLAMLELIRNKLIWAEQAENKGTIHLKPLTSTPAEEAVHNAIYKEESTEMDKAPTRPAEQMRQETEPSAKEIIEDEDDLPEELKDIPELDIETNQKSSIENRQSPIPIRELPPLETQQPQEQESENRELSD